MTNTTKKKILIIVPFLANQGGVATFYSSILPYLSSKKLDIVVLEIGSISSKRNLLHPLYDQLRFRRIVHNQKPTLVHVNPSLDFKSFIRDGLFVWQAKKKGLPVLVFFRGWRKDFEKVIEKRLIWFFQQTFARADGFIVLATEFKRKLQRWGVKTPIHLGTTTVDDRLLEGYDGKGEHGLLQNSRETNILFLARLEKEKGVFETVDAVKLLLQKGHTLSLSIAGDGSVRQELVNYVQSQKLSEKKVRFLGYVTGEDKAKVLANHDIYCLPTYGEGLPNSILEAMAFGMPVVTCPVGGIPDFFENGKMGYLEESKSPKAIAERLELLIQDREKMMEIGQYNYHYAQKNFLASKVVNKLTEIYLSLG